MGKIVKNSLGFNSDLFIYQDKSMFNYSVDTIMLGNFVSINSSTNYMLEIGTNNAVLSIFISERKSNLKIDAIEINAKAIQLANKNVELNNKQKNITIMKYDFNDYYKFHTKNQKQKYDSIVVNPPFYKPTTTNKRKGSYDLYIATHEVKLTLEQIIKGSAKIISQKGYLGIVEPTERLVDMLVLMRKYNFEPKRIQFIHPRASQKSNLVLVEARFMAGWGTHYLPNLYLHNDDKKQSHEYLENIKKLYKPIKYKRRSANNDK